MELLPINEAETKLQAEQILLQYREQRGFANMPINPKVTSAWGDGTAASTVERDPYALERLERQEKGNKFISYVDRAVAALPKQTHQELLRARYCEGLETEHPDMTAMDKLDISSSAYTERKNKALLAIAYYLNCVAYETGKDPA